MKKLYLFTIFVIILLGSIFVFLIYNYNKEFWQEQQRQQAEISKTKQEQERLTKEFEQEQQQKTIQQQQEETERMTRDQDGDGLTYQQELVLGTDDNNIDTDGDNIRDDIDRHPAGGGQTYTITVHWQHNGLPYTTQFGIHEDKYWWYKNQPRGYCCEGWDKFATPNDPTIQTIANDIIDVSISTGDPCKSCIAIDFVQSMIYQYDIDYIGVNEYPKYAIETIIDERGDCEDTSFLMASILGALNYDIILFNLPGHIAVGVWCERCTGTYYTYKGKKYYFLETTGAPGSWQIGWGSLEGLEGIIDV